MPHRAIRAGTWRPAALTRGDLIRIIWWISLMPVARGLDYILPPTRVGAVEEVMPLWVWTSVLWFGSGSAIFGMLSRRHLLVWLGHGVLAVIYVGVTLSVIIDSFANQDGFRGIGPIAFLAFLHATFTLRTGARPIDHATQAEETVVSEGGSDA